MNIAVLLVGNEILRGDIKDTNASWCAKHFSVFGGFVSTVGVVADEIGAIGEFLERESARADLIVVSGGLGPTSDDITREAIATWGATNLEEHPNSIAKLEEMMAKRGVALNANNRRQALLPKGSILLANSFGTADCFAYRRTKGEALVIALPGVPRELQGVITEQVMPLLERQGLLSKAKVRETLLVFGLSEAEASQRVEPILGKYPDVGYSSLPRFPELRIVLTSQSSDSLAQAVTEVESVLGDSLVCKGDFEISLSRHISNVLQDRGLTLAVAESCTGGLVSSLVVENDGASSVFRGGVVAYHNDSKEIFLGLHGEVLSRTGAVSKDTALEMARNVRLRSGSDFGLSITGVAGPGGGSEDKPVGTIWLGISSRDGSEQAASYKLPFDRNFNRQYAAALSLDSLRRLLLDINPLFSCRFRT